jgi:hypothetical protein
MSRRQLFKSVEIARFGGVDEFDIGGLRFHLTDPTVGMMAEPTAIREPELR